MHIDTSSGRSPINPRSMLSSRRLGVGGSRRAAPRYLKHFRRLDSRRRELRLEERDQRFVELLVERGAVEIGRVLTDFRRKLRQRLTAGRKEIEVTGERH